MTAPMIGAARLRALVGLDELIEPVSEALQAASAGRAETGLIVMYPLPDRTKGDVFVKTGVVDESPVHVVKVAPWFAANAESGEPQGGFQAVLDSATGRTLAILDDQHYLSDIRTAAAGALAARALAPPDAKIAGLLGSGVQAYWQTIALCRERPMRELLVWARNLANAERLTVRLRKALPGLAIGIANDAESVVRRSDILITATAAREPIVQGAWLRPGQHITAVGADDPSKCELDSATLHRARVFVDGTTETAENGDLYRAIRDGTYLAHAIAGEIGAVLAGTLPGRTSADDITVAKLVGIGAQDVAAATVVVRKLGVLTR